MPWKVFIPLYIFIYFKNSKKYQFHWDQKIKSNTLCLWQSLLTSHRSLSDNLQHVATGHQEFRKGSREIGHPLANIRTLQRGIIRDHHPIIYVYICIYLSIPPYARHRMRWGASKSGKMPNYPQYASNVLIFLRSSRHTWHWEFELNFLNLLARPSRLLSGFQRFLWELDRGSIKESSHWQASKKW